MSKIRIKNFGPIKEGYQESDGWMDVKKVTLFIGNQGSGKSTVAKLISTFMWIEKVLTRGDYPINNFITYNRFRKIYCHYHRIHNYFFDLHKKDIAEIEYHGDSYKMNYSDGKLIIVENQTGKYKLPQTMYVPAERNFISTVKNPKLLKISSDSLTEFLTEYDNALKELKEPLSLPINDSVVEYDKLNDLVNIKGADYKVRLEEASSGFQSLVPLYLVSRYLANSIKPKSEMEQKPMSTDEISRFKRDIELIWSNKTFTEEQRRNALSVISSKYNKEVFINIVEEPEQNLFPSSQWELLKKLLEFNNFNKGNKLIMTTHSPYFVNYISIAIQADYLKGKINGNNNSEILMEKLENIISRKSLVAASDVVVYELDEKNGNIKILPNPEGIPSDNNELNKSLRQGNEMFDNLLEIEQELCV